MMPRNTEDDAWLKGMTVFGWILIGLWIVGLAVSIAIGAIMWFALLSISIVLCAVSHAVKEIESDPETYALLLLLGFPSTARVRGPGLCLIIPMLERVILFAGGDRALNVKHPVHVGLQKTNPRSRKSPRPATAEVQINIRWKPDTSSGKRLWLFHHAKRDSGVETFLTKRTEEVARELALDKDWLTFLAFARELTKEYYRHFLGIDPTDEDIERDDRAYPDVQNLGIIIKAINVTTIDPLGKLRDNFDNAVAEELERVRDEMDAQTVELITAGVLKAAEKHGQPLTYTQARRIVTESKLVNDGHGQVHWIGGIAEDLIRQFLATRTGGRP